MTEKEEKFNKIVANYPKSDFFSGKLCPDQYVGKIADFKNEKKKAKEDFPVRVNIFAGQTADVCIKFSSYEKIMIFIPESPHQKEFYTKDEIDENGTKHAKGDPKGPTQGPTGINIRTHIAEIFPDYQDYHLIVMNAIPFQCSLGLDLTHNETNQKTRDAVFNTAWNDKNIGADFFKDRLENLLDTLLEKDIVIVNACTQGTKKSKPLCCQVCKSIINVIQNYCDEKDGKKYPVEFYHIHHPSSWNRNNNTRKENFVETDKSAVSLENKKDVTTFDCEKERWWTRYLDTECLVCSCFGKLQY